MTGIDEIGHWSQAKLDMLRQYLAAYTSILNAPKNKRWCRACHYVDAFSGGVRHFAKETYELIDGSPLLALKNKPPFTSFTFIDRDEERLENCIKPLQSEFSYAQITPLCGDCNRILIDEVLPRFSGNKFPERGFIFLDPYGINLYWDTVVAIANTRVFDVLINFSVMGVYRQLGDKPPSPAHKQAIDKLMGSGDWFSLVYQQSRQLTLFETAETKYDRLGTRLAEKLTDFYCKRLKSCFGFVSRPVMMKNSTGGPLYALILASHHKLAVDKMHEIFERTERKNGKRFS